MAEEGQHLLVCVHRVGELQWQAVGAVGTEFQHAGFAQRCAGEGGLVALGRGL
ncbi:hypothetical protein D3C79_1038880 [compost metagenome]